MKRVSGLQKESCTIVRYLNGLFASLAQHINANIP